MDRVIRIMKENGQRLTAQKKDVFCALKKKPQTVLEILSAVKSKNRIIDKTTIYRILTSFMELQLVREIHFGDREARYELSDSAHHHHLVCESCGDIKDVTVCEEPLLREVQKQSSFKVKSHSLEFFGICEKCQ